MDSGFAFPSCAWTVGDSESRPKILERSRVWADRASWSATEKGKQNYEPDLTGTSIVTHRSCRAGRAVPGGPWRCSNWLRPTRALLRVPNNIGFRKRQNVGLTTRCHGRVHIGPRTAGWRGSYALSPNSRTSCKALTSAAVRSAFVICQFTAGIQVKTIDSSRI
jgi:hypothetical protein